MMTYQVCTRCIMDISDPEIVFDSQGVCNHCRDFDEQKIYLFDEDKLQSVAKRIKASTNKNADYDCIIGVSGGVDSCMAVYHAKRVGLNPLAVHVDNGWNTTESQSNIENVLSALKVDLYTHVINWEEFKDIQKSFLKASVPNIDYPYDHAILAVVYNFAASKGLKYIIFGANVRTEFIMPRAWGYNSWDLKHLRSIHKRFGKVKIKTLPTISLFKIFYYSFFKGIRNLRILDYIDYDKEASKEFLKKEFGWKDYGAKHAESIYTKFFVGYYLKEKFGFDRNRAWMSALILSDQKSREEAEKELKQGFYKNEREMNIDIDYVINKLDLSRDEFTNLMKLPKKDHREYPNNAFFLDRSGPVVRTMRKFLRKL